MAGKLKNFVFSGIGSVVPDVAVESIKEQYHEESTKCVGARVSYLSWGHFVPFANLYRVT